MNYKSRPAAASVSKSLSAVSSHIYVDAGSVMSVWRKDAENNLQIGAVAIVDK
ncbi:hypothetical protein AXX16_3149 [Serratia rubidaea]|nr:hypothetical protein AXX16_3149 [Serratia rubidaea]